MNLLPLLYKKSLQHERMQRFVMIIGALCAAILAVGAVLLLPSYFFLFFEHRVLSDSVAFIEQSGRLDPAESATQEIKKANQLLQRFNAFSDENTQSNRIVADVFTATPPDIRYNNLTFLREKKTIEIRGVAKQRESLDVFESALEKIPYVIDAKYPSSLLAKKSNVEFTMTVSLK